MEILTPDDLKTKFKSPWIAPYKKILTMVNDDKVELVEYHPCVGGSEWMIYQYERSSNLVLSSMRDGDKHTYLLKVGKSKMNLNPVSVLLELKKSLLKEMKCAWFTQD